MKKWLIFLFLAVSFLAKAQYFQTGQDPSSLQWRQINTQNFQLIYPDYYEDQAQQLAGKLETVYSYASYTLGYRPRKISVILHTQTVVSNGLVAYAPRRSEFYTTPHQGIYPLDWLEQLAVHEFRHVVQIDKIHDALPGIVNLLLGEQGTALVFGAYLPWWFIEGDAVVTETALSRYGRGRLPSFLMQHRAQVVEKGRFPYDKAYLGSYCDFVPDHYRMGYYMVANTRERYGAALWENVLDRVGKKPFSLTPFNRVLRQETGMGKVKLYESVFDSLTNVWQAEDIAFVPEDTKLLTPQPRTFTSYTYNHWLDNGDIVSYRTAFDRIPAFVKISADGKEELVHFPGTIFAESADYRGNWLVYSEQIPDLRWAHSGKSHIQLVNLNVGQKKSIRTEFKAFAPTISPDLTKVLVVEADFSSNYYLSVYDVESQQLIKRIQTADNNYFFSPQWLNENEAVAVFLSEKGKRLAKFDLKTGEHEILFDRDLGDVKQLRVSGTAIYFIGSYTGKDALYVFNTENNTLTLVYEPRFGTAYPAVNSAGELLFSDYTANGYRLLKAEKLMNANIYEIKGAQYPLAAKLTEQEIGIPDMVANDTVHYPSAKYSKAANIFNFHSWAPLFADAYDYDFLPGLSVVSQNKLGTAETLLGYRWYTSEKTGQFYGRYIYKGWYPVLDFEAGFGKRASKYLNIVNYHNSNGEFVRSDTTVNRYTWNESNFSAAVKLPLNFTRGMFYRTLQPEFKYRYTSYKANGSTPGGFHAGNYQSLTYRLYYHQLLRRSYQDLQPDWGLVLDGSFYQSFPGTDQMGSLVAGQSILYLPGVLRNHGIKMYAAAQYRKHGSQFSFSDAIRFPRGWHPVGSRNLYTTNFDYKLPLFNPDFNIGGLAYIRRINASLFYDHGHIVRNFYQDGQLAGTVSQNISSCGLELTGEINALRFYAPIQLGARASYLPEIKDSVFDLILSVDFTSL